MEYGILEIEKLLKHGISGLEQKYPMPWKKVWKKEYDDVCVHTRGNYPKNIANAFPNEDDASKDWREKNQQAVTMAHVDNWKQAFSKAIQQSNFSFSKSSTDFDAKYKEFKQDGLDYWQWVNKRGFSRRVEDPNGLIVVLPKYTKALTVKDAGAPEIYLEIVNSKDIYFQSDELLIFECSQKSIVTIPDPDSDRKQVESYTGCIYYVITPTYYYAYWQVGEKIKQNYKLISVYKHNIGEVPARTLGGIPTLWEGKLMNAYLDKEICKEYFHSDIFPAIAHANVALGDFYIMQCVKNTVGFPIRQVPETKCDNNCVKGYFTARETGEQTQCARCKGTGNMPWPGPMQGVVVTPTVKNLAGEVQEMRGIEIKDVNPNNINTIAEQYKYSMTAYREALNMRFTEMTQSGVAKDKDKEDRGNAIHNFADYWYDILNSPILNFMNKLWFPGTKETIALNKPISFTEVGVAELTAEYNNIITTGITTGLRIDTYNDLIQKRFSGDSVAQKCEAIAAIYDPVYLYSKDEKEEMLAQATIDSRQFKISIQIAGVIRKIAATMGLDVFENAKESVIISKLDAEFNKKFPIAIEKTVEVIPEE